MKSEPAIALRKTGINVVGDMPWGTHLCHFFETREDLLDILIPYFKAGLENNEFCIWVVADPLSEEEARDALRQVIPEADRYLSAGHIEIVPHTRFPPSQQRASSAENIEIIRHTDWYLKGGAFIAERVLNGWNQKLADALAKGYAGLRANGNESWLTEENRKHFSEYEKTLDERLAGQRMIVLCSYPLSGSSAAEIFDVVNTHQLGILRRRGNWEVIETPEPIQAKAEIKRLNRELRRTLDKRSEPPAILRYTVAVLSIIAAVIVLLLMDTGLQAAAHVSLFLSAVILSTWFGGIRPGLFAIVLSILAFAYMLPPRESLAVEIQQLPRLLLFALLAFFVGSLTAAQRTKAASLRRARDVLDGTIQQLKQTNEALRREITERKQAEDALHQSKERLRLVIDTIPAMVFTALPDGTVDFVNQRWLQYMGLSLQDVQGWQWDVTIHPEDRSRSIDHWRSAMAAGQSSENELRVRRADGVYRWILGRFVPLRDESGKIVKWYGVSTDIDDRKRAEERLKETGEQLRALSASLQSAREEESKRISREIHDELGGALTSCRWDLEEIREAVSDSLDSSQVATLQTKIDGMIKLTESTLDVVRRLASELRPAALELGLVEAVEWQVIQFQNRTGIEVRLESSVEKVDLDNGQATAVFRILQESLTNIQRHAQATRVTIRMMEESGQFWMTIEDDGKGISDGEKSGGQSLGILGMRERAHLVAGEINIETAEGKGTKITLQVPLSEHERSRLVLGSDA